MLVRHELDATSCKDMRKIEQIRKLLRHDGFNMTVYTEASLRMGKLTRTRY